MRTKNLLSIGLIAIFAAACSSAGASASLTTSASAVPSTAVATTAPSVAAPTASPDACATANLPLMTPLTLTIATDNPAFPPYFQPNTDDHKTDPWEFGDPTNGLGFESAVAYGIAQKLGIVHNAVKWVYVPFVNSYAPGPKAFDFDINQVSDLPEREAAVDFSDGYYFLNQGVVAFAANPVANVTTISGLQAFRFGAQVGTSSLKTITDIIKPTQETRIYDTNDLAIAGLKAKQIDAIVADLPTTFYMAAAQLDNAKVVGQFELPSGAEVEHFSLVLAKGSALTPCVNRAIQAMKDDGSLAAITKEWLSDKASAPVFTP